MCASFGILKYFPLFGINLASVYLWTLFVFLDNFNFLNFLNISLWSEQFLNIHFLICLLHIRTPLGVFKHFTFLSIYLARIDHRACKMLLISNLWRE
ncbi:hypothetical protein FR483_n141R [Paramecium bursaria Chlorella virus FR483]|uniref:Uncharacterized protein n141R n=1 Tax=Paramecium bursaria Chlorella virus FR483 TaxID=399781 RepID=A7J6J5_PBCVF|nr:hypothetical protein FR483_n141R [Paramecium bursaria Chlorella virus FR483]ABT15426.1 hypothetical protein FR483_n141R [Paramecium bursaria Chlorella virus FR483]